MKKLMLGLLIAFAVTAEAAVTIDGFKYELDTESKTATITDYTGSPTKVDVSEVEWEGQRYTVTSVKSSAFYECTSLKSVLLPNVTTIEMWAFKSCSSLTSVSLPNVTEIGNDAFRDCGSLTSVSLPNATTIGIKALGDCNKLETVIVSFELLANPNRSGWGLRKEAKLVAPFTDDEIENAAYNVVLVAGGTQIDRQNYENGCAYYGLTPKPEPQVVKEDEIAVKKESIQAAKAEAISVADGVVTLNVNVCSNGNFTAETSSWEKAKITDVKLNDDGTVTLTVPVSSASAGFMILQSKDAKVNNVPNIIIEDR